MTLFCITIIIHIFIELTFYIFYIFSTSHHYIKQYTNIYQHHIPILANEERLLNPNCLNSVLLTHIRRTCGYSELAENIDLATENGEVMDLVSKPKDYAKKYLEPRTCYILVKVVGGKSSRSQIFFFFFFFLKKRFIV